MDGAGTARSGDIAEGGTGQRNLTIEDVPAFLDLTFISMKHLMRDPAKSEWTGPSFAQQIVDFGQDEANFLPVSASA